MEHISNLVHNSVLETKRAEKQTSAPLCQKAVAVVNDLFGLFYSLCRGFEKQYADQNRLKVEKTQWMRGFTDLGIDSLEKVSFGIKKTRMESPINTPTFGQFVKWCSPTTQELGLPSVEDAYAEACFLSTPYEREKVWSSVVVKHAATQTGSYVLNTFAKIKSFPLFERNYEEAVKQFRNGKLENIQRVIEDKSWDMKELRKKDEVVLEQYKSVNSSKGALSAMRAMLR